MPPAAPPESPVLLVCGEDEFAVKQRARQVFRLWSRLPGCLDHERIDASVNNSGEAIRALARLRESLQTLPFFGGAKVVWLQDCNFLGEDRTAAAAAVTEALAGLAQELKAFRWDNVRLLVSAGKVDKRKSFYKALEKIGPVELFAGWPENEDAWHEAAAALVRRALAESKQDISEEALEQLVAFVGPQPRLLTSEVEKLVLYAGARTPIEAADVAAIVTRNKQARSFALADALGERDLPAVLRCLDQELWEIRRDAKRNEIGLLYGLIGKVRALLLVKEMMAQGWLKPETDFRRFQTQLARVPSEALPEDRKMGSSAINPYVLFRALGQARHFTQPELIQAMDLLLECNQKLISRNLDASLLLQQTLIQIVSRPGGSRAAPARAAA
jgi:DNA polymerase-3 subunit delta